MPTDERPDFRVELPLIGVILDAAKIPDGGSPERAAWRGEVGALLHMTLRYAEIAFGKEWATDYWKSLVKPARGRPKGPTNLLRDYALMARFAAEVDAGTPPPNVPRLLGERLFAESREYPRGPLRTIYGNSAEAIAQRIRRLAKTYPSEIAGLRNRSKPAS